MSKWFIGNKLVLLDLEKASYFEIEVDETFHKYLVLAGALCIAEYDTRLGAETCLGILRDILMDKSTRFYEKYKDVEHVLLGLKNT